MYSLQVCGKEKATITKLKFKIIGRTQMERQTIRKIDFLKKKLSLTILEVEKSHLCPN